MEPTYQTGQVVRVRAAFGRDPYHVGDVVVFHPPAGADSAVCGVKQPRGEGCPAPTSGRSNSDFIKRIVAVGGDMFYIKDNRVWRNGAEESEPYIKPDTPCAELCNLPRPIKLAPGTYYVLGDNRGVSADSRVWGPVPLKWIIGKVVG